MDTYLDRSEIPEDEDEFSEEWLEDDLVEPDDFMITGDDSREIDEYLERKQKKKKQRNRRREKHDKYYYG